MRLGVEILTKSDAEYWSQIHMTPKGDGRWRMTIDFRYLNDTIKPKNFYLTSNLYFILIFYYLKDYPFSTLLERYPVKFTFRNTLIFQFKV
jgi:hypothetical protein